MPSHINKVLMQWRNDSMRTNIATTMSLQVIRASAVVAVLMAALVVCSPQFSFAQQAQAKTFDSAGRAAQALYQAVRSNDDRAVRAILGAGPELTSSGDEAVDKLEREHFAEKYKEMHRLVHEVDGYTVLYIGAENWPFPIPLVANGGKYHFDADAGAHEIIARRIGENETLAFQVSRAIAPETQPAVGQETSDDSASRFARELASGHSTVPQAFHGYEFRTVSGPSTGVVLVAYPADYRVSGVMTFVVVPSGAVYEKDLGPNTAKLATQITGKPAAGWVLVK
jgi:Protein of unknown function (DUF2950)